MKTIVEFELVDNDERVLMQWSDGKWTEQKVYHLGDDGILCDDMETYIEFADYQVA
jgi:hypothetical protein